MLSKHFAQKQTTISNFFTKVLQKNFLSRAYLFVANALEDKKLLVKELNLILNCNLNKDFIVINREQSNQDFNFQAACGTCQNCKWINEDSHPRTPINIVGTTEKKKLISVDDLRDNIFPQLIQNSDFFRIIVIEDASNAVLSKEPATMLLKTIEEAKPNIMFVLFAEHEDTVLNTIKSRSQVLRFNSNATKNYSEEALEKFTEIRDLLLNSSDSKLEMLLNSEKISEIKSDLLIEILSMFEDELVNIETNPLKLSKKILIIENSIQKLKAFVRPKSQLYDQAKEFAQL